MSSNNRHSNSSDDAELMIKTPLFYLCNEPARFFESIETQMLSYFNILQDLLHPQSFQERILAVQTLTGAIVYSSNLE